MAKSHLGVQGRLLVVALLFSAGLIAIGEGLAAAAPPTSVSGGACSFQVIVGLFGGPKMTAGCAKPVSGPANNSSPLVETPPAGGTRVEDDPDGGSGRGTFGPAAIFGGQWPDNVLTNQPSGPLHAETTGAVGPEGFVTSSTSVVLHPTPIPVACAQGFTPPCTAPGGVGGGPVQGDQVHSTCTADEDGLRGSTTFVKGLFTSLDSEPPITEPIPNSPPVNYTRTGHLTLGDDFEVIFNEQVVTPNSITVTAAHMKLLGPIAVGDMYIGRVTCSLAAHEVVDFTGNGKSDFSVYRPSNGSLWVKNGTNSFWGIPGDIPVPADYDGNGTTDVAVYRPSTGVWYILGGTNAIWGLPTDIPVPADYTGDGKADIAVYRPSSGQWFVLGGTGAVWGITGDLPVPGDYNADGKADFAVFRPSTGVWYIPDYNNISYGVAGDVPVPGDYNGNGQTNVAVYRPSTGAWFVWGGTSAFWGTPGDVPQPGDYNGDGKTDYAVYQPTTGTWAVQGGTSDFWGLPGDIPLALPHAIRSVFFPPAP